MTQRMPNRSRLLVGCGSAALALALVLAVPQRAQAQGIQATDNVVSGSAFVDTQNTTTTVTVFSPTTVIDWTPQLDNNGNALDFLPTNSTAIFQTFQG